MPRRDDDDDDNEDNDGPHFCSCCSCCCCSCCCSYWGNVFALNVLDFFLGGLFAGIGAYSFMLISASFSVLIVDHHIAWFVYPVAALGLFRIVTSFLSTLSILCNKASDAEVNRIVYKAHKSNLLLCTTFFVLFLGVLELLFALGMYELKEWTLNHLYGHLELYGNLTASDVEYFHSYYDYLNYAVVFCGVVLPLLRYRLSWAYYEDYSRSTEERDEILLRKKLKRLRKQQAREEKRKAAEAYEQEVREYEERLEAERVAEEAAAEQREIEAKAYRLEQWELRKVQIEEERVEKERLAAIAKKKRLVGTDLIIDSMNQQQLLRMGVKVGLAHDEPDPAHLAEYRPAVDGVGSGQFLKQGRWAEPSHVRTSTYTYFDDDEQQTGYVEELRAVLLPAVPQTETDSDAVVAFEPLEGEVDSVGSYSNPNSDPARLGHEETCPAHEVKLKRVPTKTSSGVPLALQGQKVVPGDDLSSLGGLSTSVSLVSQSQRSVASLPSDYFTILNNPAVKARSVTGGFPGIATAGIATASAGSFSKRAADEPAYSHPSVSYETMEIVPFGAPAGLPVAAGSPEGNGIRGASRGAASMTVSASHYLEERALARLQTQRREQVLMGSFAPGSNPRVHAAATGDGVGGSSVGEGWDDSMSLGGGSVASLGSLGSLTSMIRHDTGFAGPAEPGPNPQQQFRREQEHLFSDDVVYVEENSEDTPRNYYHDDYKDSAPDINMGDQETEETDDAKGDDDSIVSALSLDEFDEELNGGLHDQLELSFEAQERMQKAHEHKAYFAHLNNDSQATRLAMQQDVDRLSGVEPSRNDDVAITDEMVAAGAIAVDANGLPIL